MSGDVSMELDSGVAVFVLPTRIDVSNTRELVSPVRQAMAGGHRRVVLDFSRTEAMDSTALGALVQVYKSLTAEGGLLILTGVGDAVRRVLSITRLDSVFTLYATRAEAVASLTV